MLAVYGAGAYKDTLILKGDDIKGSTKEIEKRKFFKMGRSILSALENSWYVKETEIGKNLMKNEVRKIAFIE